MNVRTNVRKINKPKKTKSIYIKKPGGFLQKTAASGGELRRLGGDGAVVARAPGAVEDGRQLGLA